MRKDYLLDSKFYHNYCTFFAKCNVRFSFSNTEKLLHPTHKESILFSLSVRCSSAFICIESCEDSALFMLQDPAKTNN